MLKNKNFLLTVVLPVFASIIIGIFIIVLNNQSILKTQATAVVSSEKRQMKTDMSDLKKQKKELKYKAAEYDKQLEDNRLIIEEIAALTKELNDYTASIESAKEALASFEASIAEKTAYNESLSSMHGNNPGKTKSYSNAKLSVPTDITSGRYKAEGTGKLMIYTIAGTLQDKQNLSVLDTHTYTFDIKSGQSLKIEGTLSLTEIKE